MSRVLPNAMVGRAFAQIGVRNERLLADLPPMVELGLQKLYGFQHNDGGWGWWYDDSSHDYQTAYVLFGLAATRDAGYEVDSGVIERGATWLKGQLDQMDRRTAAYSLYALAAVGDSGILTGTQTLADQALAGEVELDAFSRAALAVALADLGDEERARELVDGLVAAAEASGEEAHWPTGLSDGAYGKKTMASTTRTTALALDALLRVQPDHPLVTQAVRWLMQRRQGKSWGTTQETSYALLALADYVVAGQEQAADYEYQVLLNGESILKGRFERADAPRAAVTIPARELKPGANEIRIVKIGEGRLYARLTGYVYAGQENVTAGGDIGVERVYLKAATNKPLKSWDRVGVGDLLRVKLTVRVPQESWYVIVEDPLPAGLEGLNERLATTSFVARVYGEEEFYWQRNGYNRKDVLDDRVAFFNTQLQPGIYTYTYLARVTHAGVFHALPAQVYLMYAPEVWGRSASDQIVFEGKR
jgi:uncharacterized protein YfaS (alpha-2-macroglobulin family)